MTTPLSKLPRSRGSCRAPARLALMMLLAAALLPLRAGVCIAQVTAAEDDGQQLAPEEDAGAGTAGEATAQGEEAAFDVWEYRVLGNTVLDAKTIERTVYPFLGPERTLSDVEAARAALEGAYRDAGYFTVLVTTPPQEVDEDLGIVRLQVTEGEVDRLHVTGSRYFSNRRLREQVTSLEPGRVPTTQGFQEDLTLLSERSADLNVQPLARSGRYPGTVEFELQVEDRIPLHFGIEANDRFTIGTSRPRLTANLSYDNLFQRQHSFGVSYQTTPLEDEIDAWSATYRLRPQGSRNTHVFYYLDNASDITTVAGDVTLGSGRTIGYRHLRPLEGVGNYNHILTVGGDYKDFVDEFEVAGLEPTAIEYLVWSALYQGTLRGEARNGRRPLTAFSVGVNFGVRGLGNDQAEFEQKRFKAGPNFMYGTGSFTRNTPFGPRLALYSRLAGQITSQPLVAQEQFALGGFHTVRGYFLAEQLVDYGFVANLELRYTPVRLLDTRALSRLYLMAFGDWGGGRIFEPLPEQQSASKLASLGLGMRAAAFGGMSVALDWAWPLFDAVQTLGAPRSAGTQAADPRFHVSVRYDF